MNEFLLCILCKTACNTITFSNLRKIMNKTTKYIKQFMATVNQGVQGSSPC